MKKIVILGQSNVTEEATRNTILCAAFAIHADKIEDCTIKFGFAPPGTSPHIKLFYALLFTPLRWGSILFKYYQIKDHDAIFVPYPSYLDGWIGCILGKLKHKKVIIDGFLGIYDTIVRDRKIFKEESLIAQIIWQYEKLFLSSADHILVDTQLNGEMLQKDYDLPKGKIKIIPVGIDEDLWKPVKLPDTSKFKVIFWCTFIPLHGADIVAKAAHLLEKQRPDIEFLIIGTGQLSNNFDKLLKKLQLSNLKWISQFIPLKSIYALTKEAHCCLGIFGNTDKTDRVIPYKVYQALACDRPVITARTQASQALFTDKKDILLVSPGNPIELANAILSLHQDPLFAAEIGKKGRFLYEKYLSCAAINQKIGGLLAQG